MKSIQHRAILLLLALLSISGPDIQAKEKPNVLFIMIDDLGWKDVGFMGSTYYETPNVDAIAANGMRFMNAYTASPLCSATRTSIMSGTWPARNGLTGASGHETDVRYEAQLMEKGKPDQKALNVRGASRLKPEYYTMAEAFRDGGYTTAHIGKWHIGTEPSDPLSQGFNVDIPHTNAPSPLLKDGLLPGPFGRVKARREITWRIAWLKRL